MTGKFIFEGFSFRKNKKVGNTQYYVCSGAKKFNCKARLIVNDNSTILSGVHVCEAKMILNNPENDITPEDFVKNFLDENANRLELYPNKIYKDLLIALSKKFKNVIYKIPTKQYAYSVIRECRGCLGLNSIQSAKTEPSRSLNGKPFLRRHLFLEIHDEYHEIMIWATNESLALMRYNSHTFIDATFRSTPSPFSQCLIIMVYDQSTEVYVPCVFALMTGKNEYMYCSVLHEIIVLLEYKWMPVTITTDFEYSLIKSVKYEFPESKLHGCYFHLKQAILRKLKKFNLFAENISSILERIELLTQIPEDRIEFGINYIKTACDLRDNNLERFWIYLISTWIHRFPPSIWGCSVFNDKTLVNRTNNSLERFNRRLNENFINAHPNLASFIETIKTENTYYLEECNQIKRNSTVRFQLPIQNESIFLAHFNEFFRLNH